MPTYPSTKGLSASVTWSRRKCCSGARPSGEREPDRVLLPLPMEPEAHEVVHEVVARCEAREHGPHLRSTLVVIREILVRHGAIVGGAVSLRRSGARSRSSPGFSSFSDSHDPRPAVGETRAV